MSIILYFLYMSGEDCPLCCCKVPRALVRVFMKNAPGAHKNMCFVYFPGNALAVKLAKYMLLKIYD